MSEPKDEPDREKPLAATRPENPGSEKEGEGMTQEEWFAMLPPEFAARLRKGAKLLDARAQVLDCLRQEYERRAQEVIRFFDSLMKQR